MSWFFRRRRPAHRVEQPLLAEAITMSAWGLTPADWAGMTDFERAECRRNITAAPKFVHHPRPTQQGGNK